MRTSRDTEVTIHARPGELLALFLLQPSEAQETKSDKTRTQEKGAAGNGHVAIPAPALDTLDLEVVYLCHAEAGETRDVIYLWG